MCASICWFQACFGIECIHRMWMLYFPCFRPWLMTKSNKVFIWFEHLWILTTGHWLIVWLFLAIDLTNTIQNYEWIPVEFRRRNEIRKRILWPKPSRSSSLCWEIHRNRGEICNFSSQTVTKGPFIRLATRKGFNTGSNRVQKRFKQLTVVRGRLKWLQIGFN